MKIMHQQRQQQQRHIKIVVDPIRAGFRLMNFRNMPFYYFTTDSRISEKDVLELKFRARNCGLIMTEDQALQRPYGTIWWKLVRC